MDWSPGGVKPKTFAASLGIRIMCPSGATCLSVDYCFSEQAQKMQINSVGLVQSRHQYHLIEMKIVLVMIYGSWTILHLVLNNNNSLWWWAPHMNVVKCSLPFKGYPIDWIRVLCCTGNVLSFYDLIYNKGNAKLVYPLA